MSVREDRLTWLDTFRLERGSHLPDGAACVMEAVAYLAGEPWSDHPICASPIITSFLISWNDSMNDSDRQMLKPYIPRLVGTRTNKADETVRAWMLTDWLARECAPAFFRCAGLTERAEMLAALAPLTSTATARKAQPTLDAARKDSAAARVAAGDAAWDAARGAAWDAARVAARDAARVAARVAARGAARDAAWDAARGAAGNAARVAARDAAGGAARGAAGDAARVAAWGAAWGVAWDAAGDAAGDALRPTVEILQASALLLLDRMIQVGKEPS